jgi:hypothetical protein
MIQEECSCFELFVARSFISSHQNKDFCRRKEGDGFGNRRCWDFWNFNGSSSITVTDIDLFLALYDVARWTRRLLRHEALYTNLHTRFRMHVPAYLVSELSAPKTQNTARSFPSLRIYWLCVFSAAQWLNPFHWVRIKMKKRIGKLRNSYTIDKLSKGV